MDWKQTYQELDNAALLSLLPLLDDRIEQAKRELEAVTGVAVQRDLLAVYYQGGLNYAATLPEHKPAVATIVDQMEQGIRHREAMKPTDQRLQRGFLAYLIMLEDRRRWITDLEAPRRGLLPPLDEILRNPPESLRETPLANPA